MFRLTLASALALVFLLCFSLSPTPAQNFKTTSERTEPTEPVQEIVYDQQPVLDEAPFEWDNADQIKLPAGFERWTPQAVPNPSTIIAPGAGWFFCSGLTQDDINNVYPAAGFRAVDIEVESWDGPNTLFSAAFVQNTGIFEVDEALVMIGEEELIRDFLFGGEWSNYRAIDLEVHPLNPPSTEGGGVFALSTEIAVLIVPNEGNQYTPEWDFIVHGTPVDLFQFSASFAGNVRIIDYEMSLDDTARDINNPENYDNIVHSQIMVSDEGLEHVETSMFQYSTVLDLVALENEGWQLIDSQRNFPLMYDAYPESFGLYTGLFVLKPNLASFYTDQDSYSLFPNYSLEDKRIIDIELVPDGGSFLFDELYLLYN